MEDQEIIPSPDFLKGFNEGYTIALNSPDLAAKLSNAFPETERGSGFKAGRAQFELEKEKSQQPKWMGRYKDNVPGHEGQSKDKDSKEDIEPEKD